MRSPWFGPVSSLAAAFALVLVLALLVIGIPMGDLAAIARFLLLSSVPSVVVGYAFFYVVRRRLRSLSQQVALAYGLGLAIALVNILITARLMFLSAHDLTLLGLLLAFSGALSVVFGLTLAASVGRNITRLAEGAGKLAEGNLRARVQVDVGGEVAGLADAFNRMAVRLEEAFARERQLDATRRDLIAAVSHDLRTPLASMRAIVEALADGIVADQTTVERYLHTLRGQIQNLSGLIDDLFELSQVERPDDALDLEDASLRDLISDTLESLGAQAQQKGVSLAGHVEPTVDPIRINSQKIQRVLGNLLQNAIRHTPGGGTVIITAGPVVGGVQVDVADTGEGMPAEEIPRVFEWFYRGEQSRSRTFGGAGLGLAIARNIVEAHGGRIWVESAPGHGSTFHFVIPRQG
jgi:signal transduction histidine kinase